MDDRKKELENLGKNELIDLILKFEQSSKKDQHQQNKNNDGKQEQKKDKQHQQQSSSNPNNNNNDNGNKKNDSSNNNNNQQKQPKKKEERKTREFEIGKYSIRHIAFKVSYLGWNHDGFAAQAATENTIEEFLWKALTKTCLIGDRTEAEEHFTKCGRTDKGVSAIDQVLIIILTSRGFFDNFFFLCLKDCYFSVEIKSEGRSWNC